MSLHQISIRLGDEPLALSKLTGLFYREDLHPESIFVSRGPDGLFCHIAVTDSEKLRSLLSSHNIPHQVTPALAVIIPEHPGGLHAILNILDKNSLKINHIYPALSSSGQTNFLVCAVDDTDQLKKLLEENWIDLAY